MVSATSSIATKVPGQNRPSLWILRALQSVSLFGMLFPRHALHRSRLWMIVEHMDEHVRWPKSGGDFTWTMRPKQRPLREFRRKPIKRETLLYFGKILENDNVRKQGGFMRYCQGIEHPKCWRPWSCRCVTEQQRSVLRQQYHTISRGNLTLREYVVTPTVYVLPALLSGLRSTLWRWNPCRWQPSHTSHI